MSTPSPRRGRVITFYSYKGGVGRSMALANIAALLAKWKRRVLVLDWDLEAPGLEKFFESDTPSGRGRKLAEMRAKTPGIVDIIHGLSHAKPIPWRDCLLATDRSGSGDDLSMISAGRDDADYAARVRAIDWETLFSKFDFGEYLESLRKEWIAEYDFVLVDSRTGVTDVGGVCSIHLPDIVIAMFTANQQSVEGVKRVLLTLRDAHQQLPLDRFQLQLVPLPGRDESVTEHEKSHEWREIFATELAEFYLGWLPSGYAPRQVLERLKIPYKPYWSFGERLPAILEGTSDPTSVGYAYAVVAKLIIGDLDWQAVAADEEPLRAANSANAGRPIASASPTVAPSAESAAEADAPDPSRKAKSAGPSPTPAAMSLQARSSSEAKSAAFSPAMHAQVRSTTANASKRRTLGAVAVLVLAAVIGLTANRLASRGALPPSTVAVMSASPVPAVVSGAAPSDEQSVPAASLGGVAAVETAPRYIETTPTSVEVVKRAARAAPPTTTTPKPFPKNQTARPATPGQWSSPDGDVFGSRK